jgi:hypothetical protein
MRYLRNINARVIRIELYEPVSRMKRVRRRREERGPIVNDNPFQKISRDHTEMDSHREDETHGQIPMFHLLQFNSTVRDCACFHGCLLEMGTDAVTPRSKDVPDEKWPMTLSAGGKFSGPIAECKPQLHIFGPVRGKAQYYAGLRRIAFCDGD